MPCWNFLCLILGLTNARVAAWNENPFQEPTLSSTTPSQFEHQNFISFHYVKPENAITTDPPINLPSHTTELHNNGSALYYLIDVRTANVINDTIDSATTPKIGTTCVHPNVIDITPNPDNCSEYFIFCLRPEFLSESLDELKGNSDFTVNPCAEGLLFDGIEKKCMDSRLANCNETYETICNENKPFNLRADPIHPTVFIDCSNGTAKRQACQPRGAEFQEEMQLCIAPKRSEQTNLGIYYLGLRVLRGVLWVIKNTEAAYFSPWIERFKVPRDDEQGHDNGPLTEYSSTTEMWNETTDKPIDIFRNNSIIVSGDEEDVILIWTDDPVYLSMYYGAVLATAAFPIVFWFISAFLCFKIFRCCDKEFREEEEEEDFYSYQYNQNDNHAMTRM